MEKAEAGFQERVRKSKRTPRASPRIEPAKRKFRVGRDNDCDATSEPVPWRHSRAGRLPPPGGCRHPGGVAGDRGRAAVSTRRGRGCGLGKGEEGV